MKNFVKLVIIALIIFVITILFFDWYEEMNISSNETIIVEASNKGNTTEVLNNIEDDLWNEEEEGYKVIAKLEIPKINLQTNILNECNNKSLLVSVCKFWGASPNEIGNFCIAGHNYYKRKNMFYNLRKLKIADKIYITDTKNNCLEYEIYDISKVDPTNTSCLSQETMGRREITLITCTNDSQKRIVVKAKET